MATVTNTWTEDQTLVAEDTTFAGGDTVTADIDLDTNGYIAVQVQVIFTFGATPDDNLLVEVFSSPDSGTTDDTIPIHAFEIEFTAATEKIKSFKIENYAYLAVKVTNQDSDGGDDGTLEVQYAGLKVDIT